MKVQYAIVGAWLSLVEHSVRDRGVGGSNPLAPTNSWPSNLPENPDGVNVCDQPAGSSVRSDFSGLIYEQASIFLEGTSVV